MGPGNLRLCFHTVSCTFDIYVWHNVPFPLRVAILVGKSLRSCTFLMFLFLTYFCSSPAFLQLSHNFVSSSHRSIHCYAPVDTSHNVPSQSRSACPEASTILDAEKCIWCNAKLAQSHEIRRVLSTCHSSFLFHRIRKRGSYLRENLGVQSPKPVELLFSKSIECWLFNKPVFQTSPLASII